MDIHACPSCQQSAGVIPVSRIYIAAITQPEFRTAADVAVLEAAGGEHGLPPLAWFAPPQENPGLPRLIHPDFVAAASAGLWLLLAGGVGLLRWLSLWRALWLVLPAAGFFYLLTRELWLKKYASARTRRRGLMSRMAQPGAGWQRWYYCPRDRRIFEPAVAPVSEAVESASPDGLILAGENL